MSMDRLKHSRGRPAGLAAGSPGGQSRSPHAESRHGSLARNWLALLTSDIAQQALSFIAVFRVARHLAPERYGAYTVVLAAVALAGLSAGLGAGAVVTTETAKDRRHARTIALVTLRLRLIAFIPVAALLTAYTLRPGHDPHDGLTAAVLAVILLANDVIFGVLEAVAFGHRMMRFSAGLGFANSVVWVAGLWLLPLEWLSVTTLLALYAAVQVATTAAYALLLRRAGAFPRPPTGFSYSPGARYLLGRGWPYLWTSITSLALTQVPVLMLAAAAGSEQTGLYTAGIRLTVPVTLVVAALARALLPHLVGARTRSEAEYRRAVRDLLAVVMVAGSLLTAALSLGAHEAVTLVLGTAFASAAPVFANQTALVFGFGLMSVLGTAAAALERQRLIAVSSTVNGGAALAVTLVTAGHGAAALSAALLAVAASAVVLTGALLGPPVFGDRRAGVVAGIRMAMTLVLCAGTAHLVGTDTSLPLRVASTPVIWAILCLWLWPETRHLLGAVHAAGFRVHHRRAPSRDVSPVAPVEATDDARIDGF